MLKRNSQSWLIVVVMGLALLGIVFVTSGWQGWRDNKILSGQVTDEQTQLAVADALIQVAHSDRMVHQTRSGNDGRYRLSLAAGSYTVTVQSKGYQPTSGQLDANELLAPEYRLDAVLRPYTLSGSVKDSASGKPIVYAALSSGDVLTQTDGNGRFIMTRISPSDSLRISANGYYTKELNWRGERALDVSLMARTIAISVFNKQNGMPLRATVLINGARYQADAQGRIVIPEPLPNTRFSASHEDFASAEATFNGQALVELALKPGAFKASVKDAKSGKPIVGATVYVNNVATVTTGDGGKFGLIEATPGARLKIKAAGYRLYETTLPATATTEFALQPFVVRGIYVPFGLLALENKINDLLDLVAATELNAIVVDVKGDRGKLAFQSDVPILKALGTFDVKMDLRELLRLAHAKNIYVIARIVTFKDEPLSEKRRDLAVKTANGTVWKDGEQLGWANPYAREVWDYNIAIAKEVAALGFDEIQFDYIRFPSDGNVSAIYFPPPHTPETRAAALRGFLDEVNKALKPYAVFTSADIFGMTVWTHDDMGIGQRLEEMAKQVDYLQPMIYPSTFSTGNLGYANPSLYPYEVILRSSKKAMERVSTPIRPWLQAYSSRGVTYSVAEFLKQKRAAEDAGTAGWTFWNAGGQYPPGMFGGQ